MTKAIVDEIAATFPAADVAGELKQLSVSGEGALPSWFDVTGLAVAAIGSAGTMLAHLADPGDPAPVTVDRRLVSLWFDMTLRLAVAVAMGPGRRRLPGGGRLDPSAHQRPAPQGGSFIGARRAGRPRRGRGGRCRVARR